MAAARAVYDVSTERYVEFVGTEVSAATEGPIDRSLLAAFVELLTTGQSKRVADVGCGPGRVAAFLAKHSSSLATHHSEPVPRDRGPAGDRRTYSRRTARSRGDVLHCVVEGRSSSFFESSHDESRCGRMVR